MIGNKEVLFLSSLKGAKNTKYILTIIAVSSDSGYIGILPKCVCIYIYCIYTHTYS